MVHYMNHILMIGADMNIYYFSIVGQWGFVDLWNEIL